MSWFDTSGFANIAKSALKEAQRTIDKALDIKDEDPTNPASYPPLDPDEFFSHTWATPAGVAQITTTSANRTQLLPHSSSQSAALANVATSAASPPQNQLDNRARVFAGGSKVGSSLWGSFTGSFFDTTQHKEQEPNADNTLDLLDDSILDDDANEPFRNSKLVVQASVEEEPLPKLVGETINDVKHADQIQSATKTSMSTTHTNRLSVISNDSDKRSSDSVEMLGNGGSSFATTPDSEMISISLSYGSKPTSESIEIVPSASNTSQSLEIIQDSSGTNINDRRLSQYTDEFVSPLESPGDVAMIGFATEEKSSPDSVEIIPDHDDADTISYTSLSESTAVTILFTDPVIATTATAAYQKRISTSGVVVSDTNEPAQSPLIITKAPGRASHSMAPADAVNVIDIPADVVGMDEADMHDSHRSNEEDGSSSTQSDRTLIASDVALESSCSDTTSTTGTEPLNTSQPNISTMLADAMVDKQQPKSQQPQLGGEMSQSADSLNLSQTVMVPRNMSPISSESRSDLVKIGSDHTSGDELETTTSSDIEIISSPNGCDSSSTHSRHSPARAGTATASIASNARGKNGDETNVDSLLEKITFRKIKGHNRELSGASSISDDCEVDRLIKRISEMTEILEVRETKLVETSRRNAELMEINASLTQQLDSINKQVETQANVSLVTEEYTQRMSALERKFQQVIREKDSLRKQLDQCKQDAASKLSKTELDSVVLEKDEIIKELREEGEKLSKQQLQHSNIIKKLRAKEKEYETSTKNMKKTIDELSTETERLKRSLAAKEEVERSQIEAVHQLTSRNKKLEHDVSLMQSQVDDLGQKYETVKKSLDAAKKELLEKSRASSELAARDSMLQSLEIEKRMTESQNEEIIGQIEDLRAKLKDNDHECLRKEQVLRAENADLRRRLEDFERRNEELTQSMLETTRPLMRQLESLQATHNIKTSEFEKVEQSFITKINDLLTRLSVSTEMERSLRDECATLKTKCARIETELTNSAAETNAIRTQCEQSKAMNDINAQEYKRQVNHLQDMLKVERDNAELVRKKVEQLEKKTADVMAERQRKVSQVESSGTSRHHDSPPAPGSISPTPSLDRASLADSSSFWPIDEHFERTTPTPPILAARCTNMLEMQTLHTNLKQRDNDLQQLQWERQRRENERTLLNAECARLLARVEVLEKASIDQVALKQQFDELQQQYDTLCQLYGEKVEETEELRLDLTEVKQMYRLQIEELVAAQKELS